MAETNRMRRCAPRRAHGAAAVEFVFIVPVLLLLLAATMTLGLATYAKFRMSDAAMVASRRCVAVNPLGCAATVPALFALRWVDGAKVCAGGVTLTTSMSNSMATVEASCAFTGGVMQSFLGMSNFRINTSAATPY